MQIHSEWCRTIPLSTRMIPCHFTLSPTNSATIGTKFSLRLNPWNSVNSFRMIPYHFALSLNESATIRTKFSLRLNPWNDAHSLQTIPCHCAFSPNDSALIKIKFSFRLNPWNSANSFPMICTISCSVRMIPQRSEEESDSFWIRGLAQIYSEWFRVIPRSVRMIPCYSTLSPNDYATVRIKFSFHLHLAWIEEHFIPNDSVPFHANSEWLFVPIEIKFSYFRICRMTQIYSKPFRPESVPIGTRFSFCLNPWIGAKIPVNTFYCDDITWRLHVM